MEPLTKASVLIAAVAIHATLLLWLSSRQRRGGGHHPAALRVLFSAASAAYFPVISYVLKYLTGYILSTSDPRMFILVVLVQFVKAKADMAALTVAAVASPAGDDIDGLKIRPSMDGIIYSFWVAGVVIYNVFLHVIDYLALNYEIVMLQIGLLWALGGCRMVLKFTAFHAATGSFALGRNAQLIDGHMADEHRRAAAADERRQVLLVVPRLIVTGERNRDVEASPRGCHVSQSALEEAVSSSTRRLVTLDLVWSQSDSSSLLSPELKDLCLSFALFKCLRRRFAGYRLAEAGSSWAFRFVRDGLLGREDDHERIFRVIGDELTFASDFYYSPLPVASLGARSAALHFVLSLLISALLCFIVPTFAVGTYKNKFSPLSLLGLLLAVLNAAVEVSGLAACVRSNWTKVSVVGHLIRCQRHPCFRRIFSCLLRCRSPELWKHEIGQVELLKPSPFSGRLSLFFRRKHHRRKVLPEVKEAILRSFIRGDGQLSAGTAAARRWSPAFRRDITWACRDSEASATDAILVWCIATELFEMRSSSSSSSSKPCATSMVVACSLSRYCTYLVAEAPDLLPDGREWTKLRYKEVKEELDAAVSRLDEEGQCRYQRLVGSFGGESSHDVLKRGSRLGKQLAEEADETPRSQGGEGAAAGAGEDAVWELLVEFWSEMVLYLAPSDDVRAHVEALPRGELMTLLWALLTHAGITSRPPHSGVRP